MKIVVFGASRGVGREAVRAGADRGHHMAGVARTVPAQASFGDVVAGDVLDPLVARRALEAADAAIVALGTPPKRGGSSAQLEVCSRGTRVVLDAMRECGLRRIVVVSSYGVGPTRSRRPFPFNIVAATLLRDLMADKERQEAAVRASDLDWTIVQPLGLTDARASGKLNLSVDGSHATNHVARADVATACLDAIERAAFVRRTVTLSSVRRM